MKWWLCWCFLSLAGPVLARDYVIGIEQIDFYPHYDFSKGQQRGYFYELMQLFAQHSGHKFRYVPLPVKRLYQVADEQVDLVYPDNPLWQKYLVAEYPKHFSLPVISTLGSTLVRPERQYISLEQFRSLAVIHGFTPTRWIELKKVHNFRIIDVPDVDSALGLTVKDRIDGANIEYNVAKYYLHKTGQQGKLVIAENLPFTQIPFLLSSVRHPQLISEFNQFLSDHSTAVASLKRKFELLEQKPAPVAREATATPSGIQL